MRRQSRLMGVKSLTGSLDMVLAILQVRRFYNWRDVSLVTAKLSRSGNGHMLSSALLGLRLFFHLNIVNAQLSQSCTFKLGEATY